MVLIPKIKPIAKYRWPDESKRKIVMFDIKKRRNSFSENLLQLAMRKIFQFYSTLETNKTLLKMLRTEFNF